MDHILFLLQQYKYVILFPLCIVEGPAIAVVAGFLCIHGILNPWVVFPVIVLGDVTGDSICYTLGRWGHGSFLRKIGNWIGFDANAINRIRIQFLSNPVKAISLSKVLLGIGVAGIYLAGNAKVPYYTFIRICLATSTVQYIVYLGIGLLFGSAYNQINRYLNAFASATIILAVAISLFYLIGSIRKKL